MEKKQGWVSVQTMATKKQHYFEGEDTVCGKYFNTNVKVKGDKIPKCQDCEKLLKKDIRTGEPIIRMEG